MALKLLSESVDYDSLEYLIESNEETKEKIYKIRGPFLQAEVKNLNGRIYSRPIIEKEVERYIKEEINQNMAYNELGHPNSPEINFDRVSHYTESLVMDGNTVIGTAIVSNLPYGKMLQTLLKEKRKVGVSSRGIGSLKDDRVGDDYKLIAIDAVSTPSGPGCFVEAILESKEYIIEGDRYVEIAVEKLQKKLDKNGSKVIKEALFSFLKEIRNH